jgi:hypothetical protein
MRDGCALRLDVRIPAGPLPAPAPGTELVWQRDDAWTVRWSLRAENDDD